MKQTLTFLLALFIFSGLFGQTDCRVTIIYSLNKSIPSSYTFKTDPQPEGAKYQWTFGDNTTSDSPSPTHTFKIADSYTVHVKVTGLQGNVCYGELQEKFEGGTITTPPAVILSGKGKVKDLSATGGCGLVIVLENGTTLVPIEMVPNFLLKDGQYLELAYELLKDRPSGCSAGVSAKIDRISEIIVTAGCKIPVTFAINSTTPGYMFKTDPQPEGSKYAWSFGDGGTSDLASTTHTYQKTGEYLINLKVTDIAGKVCSGELKQTFTVETNLPLSGRGKVMKLATTGCELVIAIENGLFLIPATLTTDFQLKEGQYVEFTYEKLAEKITACTAGPDVKILTIKEIITVPQCKAYFTATNKLWSDPAMMKKMVFSNLSTGDIKECQWNFGDNTTSTEAKPTHEYAAFGEYKVCLNITTVSGCKSDYCASVKVEGLPVVTNCSFDLVVKPKPETLNTFLFNANSTSEIKTWKWSFGDGQTSDLKNPEHAYEKTGTYEVSCTVTTQDGCTVKRTIKHTVLVTPLKTCTGAINLTLYDPTDNLCNGKAIVKLLDETGLEITNVKYLWSDGQTTGTVENLCSDKTYSVQVIIENVCQKSTSFTLLSKPIWRASTVDGQNKFTVVSPKEGVSYEWDFGDGKTLTGTEVNYNFVKDGTYQVKLNAVAGGDFSEYTQEVVVMNSITGTTIINGSELKIYPNPVKELLRINFGNPVQGSLFIDILNIAGQKVYSQVLKADGFNQAAVNIQHLRSGIYFLRITNGQYLIADRKFIKGN
ncbi:MAG TPA: hypothetical protein DCL77_15340 [Prolixibacteraceae bacterium]|nr:hypothetical protein [Prolixibacteraceae bacterium]